jgi:hypothetical protein
MNASPDISFSSEISKLKRRNIVIALYRILLNTGLIFLGICIFVFIIQKASVSNISNSGSWVLFSIGFSLAAAMLLGFLKRDKFITTLIDIDRRLRLQDRISTAYEYYKSEKKTVLSDLQIQDAAAKLHQLSTKQILPARFSWMHILLIFLIVTNAALFFNDDLFPGFRPMRADQNKSEMAGELSINNTISLLENKKEKKKKQQTNYSKELEDLRNKLNDRSITQDHRIKTLDRFLKEIQGQQSRMASELGDKLKAAEIDEMPIQKIPKLENLSLSELEKLKRILNRALNNQIPDSIDQNIEALQELYGMEERLSQMIDEFNEGNSDSDEVAGSNHDTTQPSIPTHDFKKPNDDLEHSKTKGVFSKRNRGIEKRLGQTDPEQRHEIDRNLKDEFGPQRGSSPSAGSAPSDGKKKSKNELAKSSGIGTQDKTTSAQGDNYLIQIRSLTTIGESKLKEEDIIRSYRKEIEGILQKEDMPLNYRGYIKNYFISIGLKAEKDADGLK